MRGYSKTGARASVVLGAIAVVCLLSRPAGAQGLVTDSEGGFTLIFGVSHRRGLFAEVKAGFIDSPSFKAGLGYDFGR